MLPVIGQKNDVNEMGSRLVVNGVGNGNFNPDSSITRAEFTASLVRALGLMRSGTGKDVFADVTKADWYYDAVRLLMNMDLQQVMKKAPLVRWIK